MAALDYRSIIKIEGTDVKSYLQGLLSNNIEKCNASSLSYSLLLSPQGKLLYDFFILKNKTEESYLIDIPLIYSEELLKKLNMYKLRSKIEISECKNLYSIISDTKTSEDFYPDPRADNFCFRGFVEKNNQNNNSKDSYHHKRIHLRIPELSLDFNANQFYPLELNMDKINAIDYQKGCYIGQEVTARTTYRGSVRKSIYKLQLNDCDPEVSVGSEVFYNDTVLGYLMKSFAGYALAILNVEKANQAILDNLGVTIGNTTAKIVVD